MRIGRRVVVAFVAVAVFTAAAAVAGRDARADGPAGSPGGCRGHLEWKPGAGGKAAPNAGLLFTGYTFDDPPVKVSAGGKSIAAKLEKWGFDEGRCGTRYYVVRPVGSWPKGAALDVVLGTYGKHTVAIGTVPDKKAPTATVFGPAHKKDPSSAMLVVPFEGVRDDASPIVLLHSTFPDPRLDIHGEKRLIHDPGKGELEYSSGCKALVLEDTAGNKTAFPDACR
jgi:hypothetical protein